MKIIKVNPHNPEKSLLTSAAEVIIKGGVIAYPTETVYGLGADAFNATAVRRVYEIKSRAPEKALSLIVGKIDQVSPLVQSINATAKKLMNAFWPGPLTLIFTASSKLNMPALGGGHTVALRIPANAICLELLRLCGVPIISTSANRSGGENPTTVEQVISAFGEKLDIIIDSGSTESDAPSTILDVTILPPVIKRVGAIEVEEIRRVIGEVIHS